MSEAKPERTAMEILIATMRQENGIYSAELDAAKLDVAEFLYERGSIVKPPPTPPLVEPRYTAQEKLYIETIADMREVSLRSSSAKTRVRAAILLLKWGES